MKFSTKASYGLISVIYLAQRYGERAVPVSQIAKDEGLSAAYLEQLLNRLKRDGWVKSIRGPQGGYVLTSRPSEIPVGEVLSSLGENVEIARSSKDKSKSLTASVSKQVAERFWQNLALGLTKTLKSISLQDLLSDAKSKSSSQASASPINFNI